MKKIMFNDAFGLTQAVLDGRKTMTRRIIKSPPKYQGQYISGFNVCRATNEVMMLDADERLFENGGYILPKYNIGEVVAVAQNYYDIMESGVKVPYKFDINITSHKGWTNKMFVKATLMPNKIQITNIRIERLQDISDKECIEEGIREQIKNCGYGNAMQKTVYGYVEDKGIKQRPFDAASPREAFAMLIDRISRFGTWESNPFVWVYDFELIK